MHGIWFLKSPKIKTDKKKDYIIFSFLLLGMKVLQTQKKKEKKKGSITNDAAIDASDFVAIDAIKTKMAVIAFGYLRTHMSITIENY